MTTARFDGPSNAIRTAVITAAPQGGGSSILITRTDDGQGGVADFAYDPSTRQVRQVAIRAGGVPISTDTTSYGSLTGAERPNENPQVVTSAASNTGVGTRVTFQATSGYATQTATTERLVGGAWVEQAKEQMGLNEDGTVAYTGVPWNYSTGAWDFAHGVSVSYQTTTTQLGVLSYPQKITSNGGVERLDLTGTGAFGATAATTTTGFHTSTVNLDPSSYRALGTATKIAGIAAPLTTGYEYKGAGRLPSLVARNWSALTLKYELAGSARVTSTVEGPTSQTAPGPTYAPDGTTRDPVTTSDGTMIVHSADVTNPQGFPTLLTNDFLPEKNESSDYSGVPNQ